MISEREGASSETQPHTCEPDDMDCRDCSLYDLERNACRSGKLNPKTKEHAAEVVQMLGIRALCVLNDFREPIIQRMLDQDTGRGLLKTYDRRPTRRRKGGW